VFCLVAGNWLWNKVSELHDNELVAQVLVNAVFLQLNGKWSSSCDKKKYSLDGLNRISGRFLLNRKIQSSFTQTSFD
jgi:hypothetical protein